MILAIDPGTKQSAFLFLNGKSILGRGIVPNAQIIDLFEWHLSHGNALRAIAIECIQSYGNAVGAEIFETLIWVGRFAQVVVDRLPLWPVFRKQIVLHHTRSVLSGDTQIRQAMLARFGPKGTVKNPGPTYGVSKDIWSALAIAAFVEDRIALGVSPPKYGAFAKSLQNLQSPLCFGSSKAA